MFGSVACKSSDFAMCAMSTCASKSQFPEGKDTTAKNTGPFKGDTLSVRFSKKYRGPK